eukprot:gene3277-6883_t
MGWVDPCYDDVAGARPSSADDAAQRCTATPTPVPLRLGALPPGAGGEEQRLLFRRGQSGGRLGWWRDGLAITRVEDGGAAAAAGVRERMRICSVGGEEVADEKSFARALQRHSTRDFVVGVHDTIAAEKDVRVEFRAGMGADDAALAGRVGVVLAPGAGRDLPKVGRSLVAFPGVGTRAAPDRSLRPLPAGDHDGLLRRLGLEVKGICVSAVARVAAGSVAAAAGVAEGAVVAAVGRQACGGAADAAPSSSSPAA